jgi:drug/metabolite transporter (DMT)-like permease
MLTTSFISVPHLAHRGAVSSHRVVSLIILDTFAGLAYSALLVSVFGYLLWFYLLRVYGATSVSAYHFLMPPLGLMFGWLLLGEHAELADLLGIGFGIYLVTRNGSRRNCTSLQLADCVAKVLRCRVTNLPPEDETTHNRPLLWSQACYRSRL